MFSSSNTNVICLKEIYHNCAVSGSGTSARELKNVNFFIKSIIIMIKMLNAEMLI